MQKKSKEKLKKDFPRLFPLLLWCNFIWHLLKNLNTRACALPVPDTIAISEEKEMIIFLFIYFFCTGSATNVSWPRLDADLPRQFSFAPCEVLYLCMHGSSPTFLVSQPVFLFTVCSWQTTAVCPETTERASVEEQQTTHHTYMLVFLWSQAGHSQAPLLAREDDILCCNNTENPLLILAWISSELFLFVKQKQNPKVRVPQQDEVGWTISLLPNPQAKNLHLIVEVYSHASSHMRPESAQGKHEWADGGTENTANAVYCRCEMCLFSAGYSETQVSSKYFPDSVFCVELIVSHLVINH